MSNTFFDPIAGDDAPVYEVSPEEHRRQVAEARRDALRQELGVQRALVKALTERDEAIAGIINKRTELAGIYKDLADRSTELANAYIRLAEKNTRLVAEYTQLAEKNAARVAEDPRLSGAASRVQELIQQLESIED